VCITLNEFPYIRYYVPADHGPLGALRPHESTRATARPQENSLRWRTNLARGEQVRQYEAAEAEALSRVLAFEIQAALDEYKRTNPEFPVRACCATEKKKRGLRRLTGGTPLETGFWEAACDADRDRARDGRRGAAYS